MSNDTDRTPEDDLVYEHLVELVKLIERTGQKVTGLRFELSATRNNDLNYPLSEEPKMSRLFDCKEAVGVTQLLRVHTRGYPAPAVTQYQPRRSVHETRFTLTDNNSVRVRAL